MLHLLCRFETIFLYFVDLWNVYGECNNFAVLKGHSGAILDLHYTYDGE